MKSKAFVVVFPGLLLIATLLTQTQKPSTGQDFLIRERAWGEVARAQGHGLSLQTAAATNPQVNDKYGKLPLSFEANQGQTDRQVKFLSRGSGYTLFLTSNETVLSLKSKRATPAAQRRIETVATGQEVAENKAITTTVLRMRLLGANPTPQVEGIEELPGKTNYFIGNDPKKWRTNVSTYAKVKYRAVYPGVDLVYYGNQRQLEHDFIVAPGADPSAITLGFEGAEKLSIDAQGDLVLASKEGEVRLQRPVVYQEMAGVRQEVAGSYVLKGEAQAGFHVAAYDATKPLVIDPVLVYSTFLGGSGTDIGMHVAADSAGNAYISGTTNSVNFPGTAGGFQSAFAGGSCADLVCGDAFIAKLNPSGSALLYATYLGGSGGDYARAIAVDPAGNAYVTGFTNSTDFPTLNALQTSNGGGYSDNFVTKLNPAGNALVYSTYLGGNGLEQGLGIAADSAGAAYVVGETNSSNYPTTTPLTPCYGGGGNTRDGFVSKLNPTGTAFVYSTCLGGSGADQAHGVAVDTAGNAYITGFTSSTNFPTTPGAFQTTFGGGIADAFVTKVNPLGTGLVYSTYLGGNGYDLGLGVAVDAVGNAYITGFTFSTNFPTTPGAFQTAYQGSGDAIVTKLNTAGTGLVYSTHFGGSSEDLGIGIAVDASGNAFVAGFTGSTNFPLVNPLQPSYGGGFSDSFVVKLNAMGTSAGYSTFLGGSGAEDNGPWGSIALDSAGNAYVTGVTDSNNFPTTVGAFQTAFGGSSDAFVAKITDFTFLGSGSFVIGDLNAAPGSVVTFWGAQWAKVNSLSGGPAPNVFKGFADTAPQSCGGNWTSRPGNSSNPPDSVPPFMAVVVSNLVTKSAGTISGNVPKIVIVQTNPGYGPSPGHTGTGTVVAVLCGS